jgi:putative hydrolase of the HAD superfamily
MAARFDALCLDVGGVFVVPDHGDLADALAAAGVPVDRERFWDAHYHGMHGSDVRQAPPETFGAYVPGFCRNLGLSDADAERAVAALTPLFGPSRLWRQPIPSAVSDLRALRDAGVRLAIVSNADGTCEELLRLAEVCQVGEGPFVPVEAIVDSGALGIAKPDPRIFHVALAVLGTAAERTVHVGDSVYYDVDGARAAGLHAVHFDPFRLCGADDHEHIGALAETIDWF